MDRGAWLSAVQDWFLKKLLFGAIFKISYLVTMKALFDAEQHRRAKAGFGGGVDAAKDRHPRLRAHQTDLR